MIKETSFWLTTIAVAFGMTACTNNQPTEQPTASAATQQAQTTPTQPAQPATPSGAAAGAGGALSDLKIEDVKVGDGAQADSGKVVEVNYTGWILNPDGSKGAEFDSSRKPGRGPFKFQLGTGQVIPGWDKGVAGMKVHGRRVLSIPSKMAYGERGAGNVIPPNANLIFEVELLNVG